MTPEPNLSRPSKMGRIWEFIFDDRLWVGKLALAVGLLAILGHQARRDFERAYPSYRKVPVYFKAMKGKSVSLWARPVVASHPGGFQIETDVGRFQVISPSCPPLGEHVSLVGRVAGPRLLEALAVQRNEGVRWKRPINYGISLLAAAGFLFWMGRRFPWPLRNGLFRSRS